MFQKLVRLLVRLFFFGLIAGAVGFVITRLMGGEDDDFEDFEDLESSFEFNETPVEIDVSGPATNDGVSNDADQPVSARVETRSGNMTVALDEQSSDSDDSDDSADDGTTTDGPRLIDIKGIGPSYEARLRSMGITSMSELIEADSEKIVESANVIGGVAEVDDWKQQAKEMTSGENA